MPLVTRRTSTNGTGPLVGSAESERRSGAGPAVWHGLDASEVVELDQARVGRLSRMDAMQAQAMTQASGRRRDLMLKKITVALARMESDGYGVLRSCEEAINPKRLEIDPTAILCVNCAERSEA